LVAKAAFVSFRSKPNVALVWRNAIQVMLFAVPLTVCPIKAVKMWEQVMRFHGVDCNKRTEIFRDK
jgi:hypothetical protein